MAKLFHHRVKLRQAQLFTSLHHRHSKPLKRHMFSIGAHTEDGERQGVITLDNCSSAWSKEESLVEIRRLVIKPGADCNTASFLLGKAKQACFAMGFIGIVSYTKGYESGASMKAAGFFADKIKGTAFVDGRIETLVRWGCIEGEAPDAEKREQTERLLASISDFIAENTA
jgi:hypothetical protein